MSAVMASEIGSRREAGGGASLAGRRAARRTLVLAALAALALLVAGGLGFYRYETQVSEAKARFADVQLDLDSQIAALARSEAELQTMQSRYERLLAQAGDEGREQLLLEQEIQRLDAENRELRETGPTAR